jgi:amidohydrolase
MTSTVPGLPAAPGGEGAAGAAGAGALPGDGRAQAGRRPVRALPDSPPDLVDLVRQTLARHEAGLVALRRDLHAHPELGRSEVRTTHVLRERLVGLGLVPRVLSSGTGLIVDVGRGAPQVALRADLDALPVPDLKQVPYRSTVPGLCHACGHDVHATAVLGAAIALAELSAADLLPHPVRLIFQPAEELMPGGSHDVIASGGLAGIRRIYCLHVDPRLDTGLVGLRVGAVTSACDRLEVRLHGRGGHTARPHLTQDVVHALGTLITELPSALSRRLDPRTGASLVWGRVHAGNAANAIPADGVVEGTLRCLDAAAWKEAPQLVDSLVGMLVAPYGVDAEVSSVRGVPPVVNDPAAVAVLTAAATATLGPDAVVDTEQSLGAEDFGWYLEHVAGGLFRLGVRRPGDPVVRDLHQGDLDPDERAIVIGAQVLTVAALLDAG